jgi:hypothetical protein
LAAHQSEDGRWDADMLGAGREQQIAGSDRRGAGANADTGITGLAMLAFLGAGHTHLKGEYRTHVTKAINFLASQQRRDGCLSGDARIFAAMYCHGMASFALSEAYAMTGDKRLHEPVSRAVAYIVSSQDPATGGWRYRPSDSGDTSQLGWQVMALKSANLAGISFPQSTHRGAEKFLGSVSSGRYGGLASYRPGQRFNRPMTAEALASRQFLGLSISNQTTLEAADYITEKLPGSELALGGRANLYCWYYATLALYQLQDDHWRTWNKALLGTLVDSQETEGDRAGSWGPDTTWGGYGGRVYSTAMATLCLEVYYRFLPLYSHQAAKKES